MQIPGYRHVYSGKVRDLYEPQDGSKDRLLIVASDRISAFDHILEPEIDGKGENLTAVSNFWFDRLPIANHRIENQPIPQIVAKRATMAKKLQMFPIECVVRGYLSGSGYQEYLAKGSISGVSLPQGLSEGDGLAQPIFTPATKAALGDHDENIDFKKVVELIGSANAEKIRELSLEIFRFASAIADSAGLILADTKFEFGIDPKLNQIVLGDEVLTPDSSRYWDKAAYLAGSRGESFDKQIVRNWLLSVWDPQSSTAPPRLSDEVVKLTSQRYAQLRQRLAATK